MVHHIVLWNLKEDLSEQEKKEAGLEIKRRLEAVADTVMINEMGSSNKDIALISRFETEEALKAYQVSPAHVEAGEYIRSVTTGRSCFDFKE